MNIGTIRARLTGTIIVILALFGLAGVMVFLEVRSQGVELGQAEEELGEIGGIELPLLLTIKEIKVDVIQVQQWITDISATRGLDGLNDGLDVADTYAVKFREDMAGVRQLLMSEDHMEGGMEGGGDSHGTIMAALERVEASFVPYYASGRRMAQAYIDYGPAAGNRMMSAFDAVAAEIGEATDELVAVVEADVTKNIEHQRMVAATIVNDNKNMLFRVSVAGIIGLVAAAFGGFMLYRRVSGGLEYLQNDIDLLSDFATAKGEADEESLDLKLNEKRGDEFGLVGGALRLFESRIRDAKRLAAEEEAQQETRVRQAELMEKTVAGSSDDADAVIKTLSAASTELEATAQSLTATADETSAQSQSGASAAEQASSNVQTGGTASDELGASIGEIGRQVTQSAQIAGNAVDEARKTNETVQGLAEAAQRIGEVVTLINDIAGQTNLLALNATIEAARAG
ncbi:MAG: methyl-accepting chemotaxis protein, partial [Pseudomonadota bacterium]